MRKPRNSRRPSPPREQAAPLLRSPTATLLFFGAVGLLLWGRLLLKEVPQTASAVDPPAVVQPAEAVPDPAATRTADEGAEPGASSAPEAGASRKVGP